MKTYYFIGFVITFILICYKRFIAKDEEYLEKFDHEFYSDGVVFIILTFVISLFSWLYLICEVIKIYLNKKNNN